MQDGIGRRQLLACGLGGALGLMLSRTPLMAMPGSHASACILLWLNGGPSQLEMFDPKPGTLTGGSTKAIGTRTKGLRFAAHLPGLAERSDRLAIVRSLSSREGDHARARYLLHTGWSPSTTIRHPTWGSVLAAELDAKTRGKSGVPAFVSLGADEVGPGYRGVAHTAYVVGGPNTSLAPLKGLNRARLSARQELLGALEEPFARRVGLDGAGAGSDGSARTEAMDQATGLLAGPLRQALEVKRESATVRAAYGNGAFGRGILGARRLVEAGVGCVEVRLDGWDDHADIFNRLPNRCRELDRAICALLDDLAERGLFEKTLVVCMGEFGRTPTINARGGRDHYPGVFSAMLAGGGVRGGKVVGVTSKDGRKITERPVSVPDLFATLATLHGLDPTGRHYAGERPITLVDKGKPIRELL